MSDENRLRDELVDKSRLIRQLVIRMIGNAGTGHIGGSLSVVEILVTLYFHELRIDPRNPSWPDRDRLVLSKGHAGPALYAVLAEKGFFPVEELMTLDAPGTRLTKHVDMLKLPGIDMSTGSLGQGLSAAVGMALGARLNGQAFRTYAVLSDGENDSGQTWEAAMAAAKFKLTNLTAVLDRNRLQVDGATEDVMPLEPVADKWRAFNWHVLEVDGHNVKDLLESYSKAKEIVTGPTIIIAHTTKGKGVSFAEGDPLWHNQVFTRDQERKALAELGTAE
jgi:transketolase